MTKDLNCKFFLTYRGVKLPAQLVEPLEEAALQNRNTFVRGYFDNEDRLVCWEMVVYGDIELSHRYEYDENGSLIGAVISMDGEETRMVLEDGRVRPVA